MKRVRMALFAVTSVLSLLLVPVWYFSSRVLLPDVNCKPDHHVFCATPAELGLTFQEISLLTTDAISLPAWYMSVANARGSIVFVHGHGGTRNEGLRFAKALHAAGFSLLAIDLRRNHGRYASMGYHERKDVSAALDWLAARPESGRLGLMGFSMGAATGILNMAEDSRVQAGLFSSPYASAIDVLSEAAWRSFSLPYYPLFPLVEALVDWRGDMSLASVQPETQIARIAPRPLALWHCAHDATTDAGHSRRLFARAAEPRQLWIPDCIGHERLWNSAPGEAERRAVEFFTRAL